MEFADQDLHLTERRPMLSLRSWARLVQEQDMDLLNQEHIGKRTSHREHIPRSGNVMEWFPPGARRRKWV